MDVVVVRGSAGQAIELPIATGPATGYEWWLDLPDGVARVDNRPATPSSGPAPLGAPGGAALCVTAPVGRYRIVATLARRWERDAPVSTVEIDLVVE